MNIHVILSLLKSGLTLMNDLFQSHQVRDRDEKEHLSSTLERKRIVKGVREFFEKNYELRYNVMKQTEEFRPLRKIEVHHVSKEPLYDAKEPQNFPKEPIYNAKVPPFWQQLTDRELRKMTLEQMEQVGVAWSIDVELYVRSAQVPLYNPVTDFLDGCGAWDGEDRIRAYARRVPTDFDLWPDYFHRWMLAMVAQWMNLSRDYGNAVVPMLIGRQGTHKSTFCRLLLPPELREYYIDDIKLDNAEQVERMLSRMLLVNIDEYNAQAVQELHSGAQWHFTKAEEEAICQHNERYRRESTPETLLLSFFEPAERSKECFLRAVDIQAEIKKHVQSADVPNIKMLTMALKACRFPYGAIQGCRGWYARLICR